MDQRRDSQWDDLDGVCVCSGGAVVKYQVTLPPVNLWNYTKIDYWRNEMTERSVDKKTEALKLALEALKVVWKDHPAITAIREALVEPQQEPVVWMYVNKSTHETKFQKHMRDFVDHSLWSEVPLYGEPLANHELQCVCGAVWLGDEMVHLPDKRPPAQQEPVAWKDRTYGNLHHQDFGNSIPLYASPPIEATPLASQRSVKPWVGLTDAEISQLWIGTSPYFNEDDFARAIEAKLKAKNSL